MKQYHLHISPTRGRQEQNIDLLANSCASAFDWANRNAAGQDFELFEDGRSLGRVSPAVDGSFWIVSPPADRRLAAERQRED